MDRPAVACAICGDTDNGPWGLHRGHMLCETCLDACAAVETLMDNLRDLPAVKVWHAYVARLPNPEAAFFALMRVVDGKP